MAPSGNRITQSDIARLAGVSQTVVSFIINNRTQNLARVPQATRERVLQVIKETGYVADPIARRLKNMGNRMIGVYTYEPLFPYDRGDFYYPVFAGIEEEAQRQDHDLLLLTSGQAGGRPGGLASGTTRLRVADSCVLIGQHIPREDLMYLVKSGFPFVTVGRRDDADGPVPYVGADYAAAVADLVGQALARGHRRLAYVGRGTGPESSVDRYRGFQGRAGATGVRVAPGPDAGALLRAVLAAGATVTFAERQEQVDQLVEAAAAAGLDVPGGLSVVSLAGTARPGQDVTGFAVPGREIGRLAVRMLTTLTPADPAKARRLLPCTLVAGSTLGAPPE